MRQDCDAVRLDEMRTLEGAGIGRDLQCGPSGAMSAEEDLRLLEAVGWPEAHLFRSRSIAQLQRDAGSELPALLRGLVRPRARNDHEERLVAMVPMAP